MERLSNNEQEPLLRPLLEVDLSTWDGHWFNLINSARQELSGDVRKEFNQVMWEATQQGSGVTYAMLLGAIDRYIDLVDTSNTFPFYGRERKIMEAVEQLNAQIDALPDGVISHVAGGYPEFDNPEMGVDVYVWLMNDEIRRAEEEVVQSSEDQRQGWEHYRGMLQKCLASLRRYEV